ncbi:hypothetical protein [Streptomyces meridianus]|uniref:hypothetical protein n=1 Tax=Streptomyces meridianus TaxID=2938945 RepID=UPI0027E30D5E|nr:hypothetical protein [Streptomyces meridianus]
MAHVRDRVHQAMAPERDMGELSADDLWMDAQWLEAALEARYLTALDDLLRTMPPTRPTGPACPMTQPVITTALPLALAAPAPQRAGAARARRP